MGCTEGFLVWCHEGYQMCVVCNDWSIDGV